MKKATIMGTTAMSRYTSDRLLKKIAAGNLPKRQARQIASVLERRFPTPIAKAV